MYNFKITDEPFARGFLSEKSDNLTKKVAAGTLLAAKEMNIVINPVTGLPHAWYNGMTVYFNYSDGVNCDIKKLNNLINKNPDLADDYRYILEQISRYSIGDRIKEYFNSEDWAIRDQSGGWGGTWLGHAVPNLIDFAIFGTDALREKVQRYAAINSQSHEFYEGIMMYLDAMDILGYRIGEKAAKMAAETEDEVQRSKLTRLAKTFDRCPKAPAETFVDACAVYVMLFSHDGVDSPGHFDWYMIDFWRKSDYAESREMLEDLWEFFHYTRAWNLCIGGSDENWNDKTNELTYEILDVTAKYKYETPNLTMRCHRNTPEKLLRAAAKTIGTGCGMPTFYNDEVVCPALERIGIPAADAHEYVINGCNQIDIQGKSHMGLEDGGVNLGKAVELALNNGICTISGERIGSKTGDVSKFNTFEKFYEAVKTQVHYLCNAVTHMSNKAQRAASERMSNPLRSLTIEGCLEKGIDYKSGGPLYGHGQILAQGIANCIDSIAAVKKFVYEDKKYTIKELADAVNSDFEGREDMAEFLRKSELRFGNDIDYVDEIATDVINDFNRYLLRIPTFRGGFFGGGCSPFVNAAEFGMGTGALPDGKRRGEAIYADSIGAVPGRDVKGPTALLKSCLCFDHTLPLSGFILNIKFDKNLYNTEKGIKGFLNLLKAYFDGKGQQLSVTVVSREELLDAQKNPDAHKDLIVRVGGYSDYFVNLSRELQNNVIARTDYEL